MNNLPPDGLAIPEGKRGRPESQRRWQSRLSASFAYASLACSLSFWIVSALYYLFGWLHLSPPGWRWVTSLVGWQWTLFEAFGLLLAIIATAIGLVVGAKLWRIALPVALLMFLLNMYIMGS